MKLYVAMVGLPARGKSTLAKRIRSGLEQQGIRTAIFNNGELRRMLFGLESGSAEFFNPDNTRAQRLRDQITHQNMERARAWLDEGGDVAIIDATNGTVHQRVDLSATLRDRPVLFIECVNDDPLLLDASIRRKTRLPEFANMTQEEALEINAEQYQMLMQLPQAVGLLRERIHPGPQRAVLDTRGRRGQLHSGRGPEQRPPVLCGYPRHHFLPLGTGSVSRAAW